MSKFLKLTFFFTLVFSFSIFFALKVQAGTGTIDATDFTSRLCTNVGCTTGSSIVWRTPAGTPVQITDSAVTGNIWGENIGWINLNPTNGGVANTTSGVLSGYAWGQNTGWINFKPTNGGVTINVIGEFSGYAWSQNYGWIRFDCPGAETCVKTDWRATVTSHPGGGPSPSVLSDLCPNISGEQLVIPYGYILESGQCVLEKKDFCPNIPDFQGAIPDGYIMEAGQCIKPAIDTDVCPNISGNQIGVPEGYVLENGFCVLSTVDVCLNIPGNQSVIPDGFLLVDGNCVVPVPTVDRCPNIAGDQLKIPEGYVLENGKCILSTIDYCPNLPGEQTKIPEGYISDQGECVLENEDFCPNIPDFQAEIPDGYIMENGKCILPTIDFCPNIPGLQAKVPEGYALKNGQCILVTDQNCAELGNCDVTIIPTPTTTVPEIPSSNFISNFVDNTLLPSIVYITAPINYYLLRNFSPQTIENAATGFKITSIVSAATGIVVSVGAILALNPIVLPDVVLSSIRGWSMFLTALGIRRRKRPWGTVYDSVTKQPLDPVYVSLFNLDGIEVASSITDIDGRYGFLVSPGVYKILPKKTNYIFPSRTLSNNFSDELYKDLYFGDYLNVAAGEVIIKNIPMDSINFDWNEFAKNKGKIFRFYSKRELRIARISNWLFTLGFTSATFALIVSPGRFNLIIFALYIVIFIFRRTNFKFKARGRILEQDGTPLAFAIVRVFSKETNVEMAHSTVDQMGRYHILLPNGTYYVKIEKKNDDGSYSLVYTGEEIKITKGVLKKIFKL